jgi:hypothetical protein
MKASDFLPALSEQALRRAESQFADYGYAINDSARDGFQFE